jgi:hypothetical protein
MQLHKVKNVKKNKNKYRGNIIWYSSPQTGLSFYLKFSLVCDVQKGILKKILQDDRTAVGLLTTLQQHVLHQWQSDEVAPGTMEFSAYHGAPASPTTFQVK